MRFVRNQVVVAILLFLEVIVFAQTKDSVELHIKHGILLASGSPAFRIIIFGWTPLCAIELYIVDSKGQTFSIIDKESGAVTAADGSFSVDIPYNYKNINKGYCTIVVGGSIGVHMMEAEIPSLVAPSDKQPEWQLLFSDATIKIPVTQAFPDNSAIIRNDNFSFYVKSPEGWIIDINTLAQYEISALFYKHGVVFSQVVTHMYISVVNKKDMDGGSLADYMDWDEGKTKQKGGEVATQKNITIKNNKVLIVRYYDYKKKNRFEIVSYLDEPDAIVMFTLTVDSIKEREKEYNTYLELCNSYKIITD